MRSKARLVQALFALALLAPALYACAAPPAGDTAQSTPPATGAAAAEPSAPAEPSATAAPAEPTTTPQPLNTPAPTATVLTATVLTATPPPTPVLVGLDGTLVLYTTLIAVEPATPAPYWQPHHAFKTWPPLPFIDPAVFDKLYGEQDGMSDFSMFFSESGPKPSPDGRYVLVPGLASYPEYGFLGGTGTWLLDLEAGAARQLLPDGVLATWSPASDAITYVRDDTLYTLSIAEGAEPQVLLQAEGMWPAYWSPDGRSIATLVAADQQTSDSGDPRYFVTVTVVPVNGDPVRELAVLEVFGMEYSSSQMGWSPDGQYLLVHNKVYDLDGNLVSPDYSGGVYWLPNDTRLLRTGSAGLDIITIAGEVVAHISDQFSSEWAFSHDGRRLAYTQGSPEGPYSVVVYDLERGENWTVRSGSAWPLRWSADDSRLILGVYGDEHNERSQIVTVSVEPGGEEQLLLDNAQLIEVIPYPPQ